MDLAIRIIGGDLPPQRVILRRRMRFEDGTEIDLSTDIRSIKVERRGQQGEPHSCRLLIKDGRTITAVASDEALGRLFAEISDVEAPPTGDDTQITPKSQPTKRDAIGCGAFLLIAFWLAVVIGGLTWLNGSPNNSDHRAEAQRLRDLPPSATKPHVGNRFAIGELTFDAERADRGLQIFENIIGEYPQLDAFYRSVDHRNTPSGFAASISIPEDAWNAMNDDERTNLGHFMSRESPFNGWHIVIGEIRETDILSDSSAMSSLEWPHKKPPDARFKDVAERRAVQNKRADMSKAIAEGDPGPITDLSAILIYHDACALVRKQLKAPLGAKFAPFHDRSSVSVNRMYDGNVRVRGWVDAENSFGAMLRTRWTATLEPTPNANWRLIRLDTSP